MSGLMDKAQNALGKGMDKQAQPGDSAERSADSGANNAINNAANQAGVPQQDDKMIDDVADKKINDKLPGGN